jgi:pimeloyl-ACP methyl ester carboxylesterase
MGNGHSTQEHHFQVPSHHPGLSLHLNHLAPASYSERNVLYVHGGTFPSSLAINYRFDGRSWRDALCAAGFHVWGLDFHGFGCSDPYPEMARPADANPPLGRADDAALQLERAILFIRQHQSVPRVALAAHSWGTIVAGLLAGRRPELVERIVMFGPIARREPKGDAPRLPAWRPISLADQWNRFTEDVPPGADPVLLKRHFLEWGERYLDTDPASRDRDPAAVRVPCGAFQDIHDAFAGHLAYDPGLVQAPVAIVRGEWDGMCRDEDARWLFDALSASSNRRDIKIARGTHLMHLETARYALYRETETFLSGDDVPPPVAEGGATCSP